MSIQLESTGTCVKELENERYKSDHRVSHLKSENVDFTEIVLLIAEWVWELKGAKKLLRMWIVAVGIEYDELNVALAL